MRIAVISTIGGCPWGGSEELWSTAAVTALGAGHSVVASVHPWPQPRPKLDRLIKEGVEISVRRSLDSPYLRRKERFYVRHPNFTARQAPRISAFKGVLNPRPDVVCLSQGDSYNMVEHFEYRLLMAHLQQAQIPLVFVIQLSREENILADGYQTLAREYFSYAHTVAFVAAQQVGVCEQQLACKLPNARVVRNPVNISDTAVVPWPAQSNDQPLNLAVVARVMTVHKGHDILFEALSKPPWTQRNWRLRIVGSGPHEKYLQALAKFLGIADRVEFRGHATDIRGVWEDNHLLVMPSRMEAAPLAIVEAMLCGRPVVATDVGGVKEWVEEDVTGFVAPYPKANVISAALEKAWAVRDHWREMGLQAHDRAARLIDPHPDQTLLKILDDAVRARRT